MESFEFKKIETVGTPEKLYRGFVVSPDLLSVDFIKNKIKPTETSGNDGNEKGVYMSDNLTMVESTNYSSGSRDSIQCREYDSGYGKSNRIELPGCGIVIEIETKNLSVREPKISSVLAGHYNNGFKGKEWICDEIPQESFRVKKLVLSTHANDTQKFVVELKTNNEEELNQAINEIKNKFFEIKKEAEQFKSFLETLPEKSFPPSFILKKKFQDYKNART